MGLVAKKGNAMHTVRTHYARSAKFWMSTNTRTLVSAPFHKFWFRTTVFFTFLSIQDVAHLNCQGAPFKTRDGKH